MGAFRNLLYATLPENEKIAGVDTEFNIVSDENDMGCSRNERVSAEWVLSNTPYISRAGSKIVAGSIIANGCIERALELLPHSFIRT